MNDPTCAQLRLHTQAMPRRSRVAQLGPSRWRSWLIAYTAPHIPETSLGSAWHTQVMIWIRVANPHRKPKVPTTGTRSARGTKDVPRSYGCLIRAKLL